MTPQEIREALEHKDVLEAIRDVLSRPTGRRLFKYLFKEFSVAEIPDVGYEGVVLHGMLGHYRAGSAIYKIACEANADVAGQLLAEKEKDAIDELYKDSLDGSGEE